MWILTRRNTPHFIFYARIFPSLVFVIEPRKTYLFQIATSNLFCNVDISYLRNIVKLRKDGHRNINTVNALELETIIN